MKKGSTFTFCCAQKTNFIVEEPFTCPWGQTFHAGDITMVGKYYQNWGWTRFAYVLLMHSQTTYIHACHVQIIKFPMLLIDYKVQSNELVYKLSTYEEDAIKDAIASIELQWMLISTILLEIHHQIFLHYIGIWNPLMLSLVCLYLLWMMELCIPIAFESC
jgi:hypothetical protein